MVVVPALYSFVLAALVFGPLFGPGYLLLRDAVSTPHSYLTDSALGLTDAAPRAVPQDWLLAVTSSAVDGGVVVKVILFAALWLAGWGGAVLVRTVLNVSTGPQLVAATLLIWNPYVAERLLQGHWSLLVGYAALPWTVCAAVSIRRGSSVRAWCALAACLAAAALTPTGALLAAVVALVVVGKRWWGVVLLFLVASAPWLVATLVSGSGSAASDPAGVAAFAARAEPGLGTVGSLAGLGGIWNSTAVPGTRGSWFALVGTVLLLVVVGLGVAQLWRRRVVALPALSIVTVVLIALAATPWGLDVGRWAVESVPGAGLLRDSQKWVALAVPGYALAAAAGAHWLGDRLRFLPESGRNRTVSAVLIALLGIALPDLAWGVGGQLKPVHYPSSWEQVAAKVDDGDLAVLPTGMFRIFPYTRSAPVLDPAPRMLSVDVLQTGELLVAGGKDSGGNDTAGKDSGGNDTAGKDSGGNDTAGKDSGGNDTAGKDSGGNDTAGKVTGEGSRAKEVEDVLLAGGSPQQLSDLRVRWVLVERTSKGPVGYSARTLDRLNKVFEDPELTLYRVDGTAREPGASGRGMTIAAHVLWIVLLAGGLLGQVVVGFWRRRVADQGSRRADQT
ncbi:hypothetical protein [Antrihabitans cavernicola]|uniref:hypothetical protein n=1 Tax=Antrihabitans cavernicola TaxID=2495913 RepID=UPI001F1F6D71|nr:hypothetical protein [Spelaeibacter cavernicola]